MRAIRIESGIVSEAFGLSRILIFVFIISLTPMITIDQFKDVDIRIGKILSAEEVPNTDKLLKLSVDFGEEVPRQIISGIKQYVPDIGSLVGKKTTFVVNLEPRVIQGLESNGMLFAPSATLNGERIFSFIVPEGDIPPGARLG